MITLQGAKWGVMLAPISLNDTAATCLEVDTAGSHYATIVVQLGAIGAASMDEVSITECDTTGGTFTAVTGGTWTDPTQTDDGKILLAFLDLRNGPRKRFLKLVIDPGAVATLVGAVCILTRGDQYANTDAERSVPQTITPVLQSLTI